MDLKKAVMLLTDSLFFDTDCISAFLWVDNESILAKLFPGKIVIPKEVYEELSNPRVNQIKHLKNQVDSLITNGQATIETIDIGSKEYEIYRKLTVHPDLGKKIIGKGEAASIALAKERNGIVASNNLKDISSYIEEYGLTHYTTGDIMLMALNKGLINEEQGNIIWANMISKRRKLGYSTFTEYINDHK